eukprot:3160587-Pyramimonas_sp.AAC.1
MTATAARCALALGPWGGDAREHENDKGKEGAFKASSFPLSFSYVVVIIAVLIVAVAAVVIDAAAPARQAPRLGRGPVADARGRRKALRPAKEEEEEED